MIFKRHNKLILQQKTIPPHLPNGPNIFLTPTPTPLN